MRRYTTRAEDAAFMAARLADYAREWKVGDACLAYRGGGDTTVAAINGEVVTCANGDQMHVSRMRSPKAARPGPPGSSVCRRCGALKADHMDYGRGVLYCPTITGGTYTRS